DGPPSADRGSRPANDHAGTRRDLEPGASTRRRSRQRAPPAPLSLRRRRVPCVTTVLLLSALLPMPCRRDRSTRPPARQRTLDRAAAVSRRLPAAPRRGGSAHRPSSVALLVKQP